MLPYPGKLVRCASTLVSPQATFKLVAACEFNAMLVPTTVCPGFQGCAFVGFPVGPAQAPTGLPVVGSIGPVPARGNLPCANGFCARGRGRSWLPLLSNVKCVPLLPTYAADRTM